MKFTQAQIEAAAKAIESGTIRLRDFSKWSEMAAKAALTAAAEVRTNGARELPFSRDEVGRMVREAWVRWAQTHPNPKPSWLVSYDELSEADKEADRQIGEAVARWTLIFDAAAAAEVGEPLRLTQWDEIAAARADMKERCAQVAENYMGSDLANARKFIAAAIRAMKVDK